MTNFGSWMTSIFQEILEIARPSLNAAFAENSKLITDVVAIAMALRDVAASIIVFSAVIRNHIMRKPAITIIDYRFLTFFLLLILIFGLKYY